MKHLTAVLVAMGFSAATIAAESPDLSRMEKQSYEQIAWGEALPPGESAYGYSLSDPYTDGTIAAAVPLRFSAAAGASTDETKPDASSDARQRKLETETD